MNRPIYPKLLYNLLTRFAKPPMLPSIPTKHNPMMHQWGFICNLKLIFRITPKPAEMAVVTSAINSTGI